MPARVGEHGSKKPAVGMFWKGEGGCLVGHWKETRTHQGGGVSKTLGPAEGAGGPGGLSQEPQGWQLGPDSVDGRGTRVCLASVNI